MFMSLSAGSAALAATDTVLTCDVHNTNGFGRALADTHNHTLFTGGTTSTVSTSYVLVKTWAGRIVANRG
jgi:hypothetical protein